MATIGTKSSQVGKWVPTACEMCYMGCGILVRVENNVVVEVKGDPGDPQNLGKMCAKGKAGIMNLYNPCRVTTPLKRTNPEKGIGVDPRWVEISWDEALDTVAARMRTIYQEDPRRLYVQTYTAGTDFQYWMATLRAAFGTPNMHGGQSPTCGKVVHPLEYISGGGFHQQPDFHYANYCVLVGTQTGVAARGALVHLMSDLAEAQQRGMKLVVVDPVGAYAASKADQWVPIRPGTDAAFALGMLNVLLNELQVYDVEYLKHRTNAPYLVRPNGKYVRHAQSGKPLLYDAHDARVKQFDDPTLTDPSLEGEHEVDRQRATTAFEALKAHVRNYPPGRVEEITTIPAGTLRRIAREFGEAAQIGATITIDGVQLPYRPVCVDWAKGPSGHKHAFHSGWSLKLLNIVMGAVNVPGGIMSTEAAGKYPAPFFPQAGKDGMLLKRGHTMGEALPSASPGRDPQPPTRTDLFELFPVAGHASTTVPLVDQKPEKYRLPYRLEMVIHTPGNLMLSTFGDARVSQRFFQDKFVVGFAVEINETTELDDIVLPFPAYLEADNFVPGANQFVLALAGDHEWYWRVRQKVVEPPPGVRLPHEVLMELCARVGILDDFYTVLNRTFRFRAPHLLEAGRRYTAVEVFDRHARSWFGEEHGWEWFKKSGGLPLSREVEERYPGPFIKARLPIFLEHLVQRGEQLQEVVSEMGIPWDTSDYVPLPEWKACEAFDMARRGQCDVVGVHYKLPFVYGSYGAANPWIEELCERNPYAHTVLIHEEVARHKGIKDGDTIWIESPVTKVKARVKVTQCIHPEVAGIAGHFGHWGNSRTLSKGKGVNFNSLLPHDMEHLDMLSTALEHCVPLTISKA